MVCSRSVSLHLLRGALALALIVLAFSFGVDRIWLTAPALIGAVVLMRGCPTCWAMGLVDAIAKRRDGVVVTRDQ